MSKKLIELHKKWMEAGKITGEIPNGLCHEITGSYRDKFILIMPSDEELVILEKDGFDTAYWASELPESESNKRLSENYGALRQTIVLLICAMNNEL